MALSELDMMNLLARQLMGYKSQWERLFRFGYAIEAEVRNQDDELILQLVDALEQSSPHTDVTCAWKSEAFAIKRSAAITAARARLQTNKPC